MRASIQAAILGEAEHRLFRDARLEAHLIFGHGESRPREGLQMVFSQ